mmetsp:Transcript_43525/g.77873  ORF Transcript_43525/g.77873 Transcript_43525/m.77873 type:complete len:126 (-) Transcript_43525:156-533(-)|eukprot:CAMPEP_0177774700 /NCGR_PEP_ID=MMETSP0491_2-20121128/13674_1 /TAXON_ID=63592 /ORGANISM="Tetraselmis chuii, Strain PLY429" /LENGTH=125 /DNA_ID=CAMNT_0019293151 /DNA_START=222 /DNA_END=599 /DNA_ORIENTATION=+
MSFLAGALRAYRDKYIVTGSSKPLQQVMTYVGCGMFFVECSHHYLHTRDARKYTTVLESKVDEAKADLATHLKAIEEEAHNITAASAAIQASTKKVREMEHATLQYEAKIEEAKQTLSKHVASLH